MENFIDQVESHLRDKTLHELKTIVLKLAAKLPENSRVDFLSLLKGGRITINKNEASHFGASSVLTQLSDILEGVEDYNIEAYYNDDWDNEGYDIQNDDGFCDDFYKGYNGAVGLLEQGAFSEAAQAFDLLFQIVERFDEHNDGECSVSVFIDENMLKVDLQNANALFGYSQLMSDGNLQEILQSIYNRRNTYARKQPFIEILEAGNDPIPNREKLLETWVEILHKQPPQDASPYVKEAAILSGKIEIMENFVLSKNAMPPCAYIDLCELYMECSDVPQEKIIAVAKEGVKNTAENEHRRTGLATILANAAKRTNDSDTYAYAVTERFYSNISVNNFLPIFAINDENLICNAIARMDKKFAKERPCGDFYIIHLLNKEYDMVFDAIQKDSKSLGWSGTPKGALVPFFIGILAGFCENAIMVRRMVKESIRNEEDTDTLYKLLRENMPKITPDQYEKWHDWCVKEVSSRTEALVKGGFRGSYFKAAYLLVGLCEVDRYMNVPDPYVMLHEHIAKFPRHSAFKSEVREALNIAGIKDVKI